LFLRAIPSSPGFTIGPSLFPIALRHLLFESQPVLGGITTCGSCGARVDPCAEHYITCRGTGNWYTYLHHSLVSCVSELIRSVYPHAIMRQEDAVGSAFYSPRHRPDISLLGYRGTEEHMLIECTVFRPFAVSHLRRDLSSLVESVVTRRESDYGDVRPHRLVVFAVSDFGQVSTGTAQFLYECARARSDRLLMEGRLATSTATTWSSFWRQRLSVTLARAIAHIICYRSMEDYAAQRTGGLYVL
jgi:hypothetical protein